MRDGKARRSPDRISLSRKVLFGYDELSEGYDASFALDEIQFIGCELPPWQEECPEEFHCGNGVQT